MRTLLVHLYPASWRGRYAEEFGALLDASSPVLGAVGCHAIVAA
jgi:hypothetical protein